MTMIPADRKGPSAVVQPPGAFSFEVETVLVVGAGVAWAVWFVVLVPFLLGWWQQ